MMSGSIGFNTKFMIFITLTSNSLKCVRITVFYFFEYNNQIRYTV